MKISVIIPTLNEEKTIVSFLESLNQSIASSSCEVIIVDGGSCDKTVKLAKPYVDRIVMSSKGRALQMNTGAKWADGDILLFLHCDTQLPDIPFPFIGQRFDWGFYKVRLTGKHTLFRIIERMMNWRSTISHVATGDQCLFIKKQLFNKLDGYAEIPLMEDVEMSKRLREKNSPYIVTLPVSTSSRRWEKHGIVKTIVIMWYLRVLYFLGVSPDKLVKVYYG